MISVWLKKNKTIYKEERPSPDGRKVTFPDSNHLIIEAMVPGNVIFDKIGEIRAMRWLAEAVQKNVVLCS